MLKKSGSLLARSVRYVELSVALLLQDMKTFCAEFTLVTGLSVVAFEAQIWICQSRPRLVLFRKSLVTGSRPASSVAVTRGGATV